MMSKSKQLSLFASVSIALVLVPVAARIATASPEKSNRGSDAHLRIGLVCNETTSSTDGVMRGWDPRFSGGRVDEQCVDKGAVVSISPLKVSVEMSRFSGRDVVAVEMTAADGQAVERLFAQAINGAGGGQARKDVILLNDKVIVSAFVFGPFQGRHFQIDPASSEVARSIVKALTGDPQGHGQEAQNSGQGTHFHYQLHTVNGAQPGFSPGVMPHQG